MNVASSSLSYHVDCQLATISYLAKTLNITTETDTGTSASTRARGHTNTEKCKWHTRMKTFPSLHCSSFVNIVNYLYII